MQMLNSVKNPSLLSLLKIKKVTEKVPQDTWENMEILGGGKITMGGGGSPVKSMCLVCC